MSDFWYWNKGKIISLVIGNIYILLALFLGKKYDWLRVLIFLILPLACIWFPDEMSDYEYYAPRGRGRSRYTLRTPACLIKILGWILLFFPIIIVMIYKAS